MTVSKRFKLHEFIDRVGASLGRLVYRNNRLFSKSLESVSLKEAAGSKEADVGEFTPGTWQKAPAKGPAG